MIWWAQIPPPAQGGTTPPPGTPFNFTVGLLQDGSLELKCPPFGLGSNPSGTVGTIYEVKRKVAPPFRAVSAMGSEGTSGGSPMPQFTFVGATGVKTITDDSLPSNASPCTYQVTGRRGDLHRARQPGAVHRELRDGRRRADDRLGYWRRERNQDGGVTRCRGFAPAPPSRQKRPRSDPGLFCIVVRRLPPPGHTGL